tara:strand:+ start:1717 stop:1920 length:204 start_codon:yes stop_codon:yes gene_type:complete
MKLSATIARATNATINTTGSILSPFNFKEQYDSFIVCYFIKNFKIFKCARGVLLPGAPQTYKLKIIM